MQSLGALIKSLQREIAAALQEQNPLPNGARLEAERIILSLSLATEEQRNPDGSVVVNLGVLPSAPESSAEALRAKDPTQAHTLMIEFRLASTTAPVARPAAQSVGEAGSQPPNKTGSASPNQLADSLVAIFGAPGFDSSARATVFREALAGLSDDQARAIIDSLRGMPTPGITPAAARARQLISRLVESGPGGPASGREVLAEAFYRHSVQSLIRLVRDKWKTQEEWLDEPIQRPATNPGNKNSGR